MIKVRAGQVWTNGNGQLLKITVCGGDLVWLIDMPEFPLNFTRSAHIDLFDRYYKFIPQNDLEFAAVTLDKWPPRTAQIHVKGGEILGCLLHNPNAINECQWQNMRYHLGQDKKPHYRLTGGEWVKQCKK